MFHMLIKNQIIFRCNRPLMVFHILKHISLSFTLQNKTSISYIYCVETGSMQIHF